MNAPLTLSQLAAAWQQAKADEQAANARRLEIEQAICAAMPASDLEAVEKAELGNLTVQVTYKLSRSVNSESLAAVWATLPDPVHKAFRWKAEANLKQLRALQEMLPEEYRRVAVFLEAKPAKPSVVVQSIEVAV